MSSYPSRLATPLMRVAFAGCEPAKSIFPASKTLIVESLEPARARVGGEPVTVRFRGRSDADTRS